MKLNLYPLLLLIAISLPSLAQKQLVFIHHGVVVARYSEGGNIKLVLKNGQKKSGFIVELSDFSMITSNDTIQFKSILKIDSRSQHKRSVTSGIGGLLFIGGLGYIAIDQINSALGYGKSGWDRSDQVALMAAGAGAVMIFVKPRYSKLKPGTSIRMAGYDSPFYLKQ